MFFFGVVVEKEKSTDMKRLYLTLTVFGVPSKVDETKMKNFRKRRRLCVIASTRVSVIATQR